MARLTVENRKWWILATMTGALSMVLIDETVVSVALPAIQRDLHMSQAGLQWVVNAYLLALASCVAAGGRLGDLFGQARMFRLGALAFVTASAGCGLAQSQAWIIAARAVQGLGAAAMIPATGTIVINAFHARERGRAMGRARVTAAVAAAHGDPALLGRLSPGTLIALRDSLLSGISSALYIGGGVVLAGAVVAWALLRRVSGADAPASIVLSDGSPPDVSGGLAGPGPAATRQSSAGQRSTLRDREEARGLGRQRVEVGAPDGGELPSQRRPGDLDGDQPAEHEVVADGQSAEYARPYALRDR